jgi:hypothetical protein
MLRLEIVKFSNEVDGRPYMKAAIQQRDPESFGNIVDK